ncbi:MAG TPA: peptidylprolyl isomerase [Steroidobacteraceae bacterium]|nr:peptidylprolyl isomerase [Steroidobacteraceae bacterium]
MAVPQTSIHTVSAAPRRTRRLRWLLAQWTSPAQRRVALPVMGMVVGLILAGVGLFHRAPRSLTQVPPGYVALVNQQGVLMSDFISQTATETEEPFDQTTMAQRAHVLHEMIDKELLVQRALVLDLPETIEEVRTTMADAVDAQAAAPEQGVQPTDAQLRAYYEAHRDRYSSQGTMTVQNLVLHVGGYQNADQTVTQAQADAIEAVYQLRSGASVAYLMEHFGFVDATPQYDGQQLDFAAKLHLGARLYQVAMTLGTGEVSDPIVQNDGVHVLIMHQRQPATAEDFSAARAQVYNDYRIALTDQAAKQNLQFLRSQAQILLAPGQSE